MPLTTVALLTLAGLVALFVVYQSYILRLTKRRFRMVEAKYAQLANTTRARSNQAQRSVLRGQLAERVIGLLPGFPFNPNDFLFIGNGPVDFIVIEGLAAAKDGQGKVGRIIVGDIKSGGARLSSYQQEIKNAVAAGKVDWVTLRVDNNFQVKGR